MKAQGVRVRRKVKNHWLMASRKTKLNNFQSRKELEMK